MSRNERPAPNVNDLQPNEQTLALTTLAQRDDAVGEAVREEIERVLANAPESVAREIQIDVAQRRLRLGRSLNLHP